MTEKQSAGNTNHKIDKIYEVIFEGNGHPSMLVRLAQIEQKLSTRCPVGEANKQSIINNRVLGGLVTIALFAVIAYFHVNYEL